MHTSLRTEELLPSHHYQASVKICSVCRAILWWEIMLVTPCVLCVAVRASLSRTHNSSYTVAMERSRCTATSAFCQCAVQTVWPDKSVCIQHSRAIPPLSTTFKNFFEPAIARLLSMLKAGYPPWVSLPLLQVTYFYSYATPLHLTRSH